MYTLYLYTQDPDLYQRYSAVSVLSGDAGVDLYVPENVSGLKDTVFLDHRVSCRMTRRLDTGEEVDVSYYLYPRSSLSKTRLRLANSVGIIDAGYRGAITAAFDVRGQEESVVKFQRLVQICAPTLEPVRLVLVDQPHAQTERGDRGFGSTGR
jgi:dUTP pyrophosphatase